MRTTRILLATALAAGSVLTVATAPAGPVSAAPASVSLSTWSTKSNKPVVRQGNRGEAVRYLQQSLKKFGYSVTPDGIFGPVTRKRVMAFQRAHGLYVDGIVGAQTWRKIDALNNGAPSGGALVPFEKYSASQVKQMIRDLFPEAQWAKALAVADRESRFNHNSTSGSRHGCTRSNCVGVFQIYFYWHKAKIERVKRSLGLSGPVTEADLRDPRINIRVARLLWQDQGWKPWGG